MAAGGSSTDHRRGKSGLFLVACGGAGLAPHWLPESLRLIPALILAVVLGGYSLRTLLLQAFRPYTPPRLRPCLPPRCRLRCRRWMWWWRPAMNRP